MSMKPTSFLIADIPGKKAKCNLVLIAICTDKYKATWVLYHFHPLSLPVTGTAPITWATRVQNIFEDYSLGCSSRLIAW